MLYKSEQHFYLYCFWALPFDETVHREPYLLNRDRPILMERLDQSTWMNVMKRTTPPPLDCDPMVRMPSHVLNLGRYNSLLSPRALDGDPVDHEFTRSTHLIHKPFDLMLLLQPRHLLLKLRVELSPTQKKLKGKSGFIRRDK